MCFQNKKNITRFRLIKTNFGDITGSDFFKMYLFHSLLECFCSVRHSQLETNHLGNAR